jgi:hypothetical protein
MTDLFRKLNWKAQNPILIAFAPASFAAEAAAAAQETTVHTEPAPGAAYTFTLTFAVTQAELVPRAQALLDRTAPEAILWFVYPKQTSKAYVSDLNRDILWKVLAPLGLSPNRQVAIDDDWSALRFKKDTGRP